MDRLRPLRYLAIALLAATGLGASCGEAALQIMPGLVNDPSNRSLRRAIFAFAQSEICKQMRGVSIPLKMRDADPGMGRFFPTGCAVKELENGNLFVQFTGHGYAWTNVTRRLGFEAAASVEYAHDFLLEGSTMYVYFRQRTTESTQFQPLVVEAGRSPVVSGVVGLLGGDVTTVSTQVGARILQHQLARGFTVVRQDDGSSSFSLGALERGERPSVPFDRGASDWQVLANDRVEVHTGQRDFVGPFVIGANDALYLTLLVEGAPQVDVLVVPRAAAEPWIGAYEREMAPGPPPSPPILDETVTAEVPVPGRPPVLQKRTVRAPPGAYYVVFDQTATAGQSQPAGVPSDDRAAHIRYAVQLGDAP